MVIEFTVGNFRSFEEPQTFSMVAANLPGEDGENSPVMEVKGTQILRSAAIYGANASGKSNLIKAIIRFLYLARHSSSRLQDGDALPIEPFALRKDSDKSPSFFEMIFFADGRKLRYGFEATSEKVTSEWLFSQTSARETRLFTREGQSIDVNKKAFSEGVGKEAATRENSLFLSLVAQLNGKMARKIVRDLSEIKTVSGLRDYGYENYTASCLSSEDHQHRHKVLEFLRRLDLSFEDVQIEKQEADTEFIHDEPLERSDDPLNADSARTLKKVPVKVMLLHPIYDAAQKREGEHPMNLRREASEGTRKLFGLAGPIVDVLSNGYTLFVDEMDARLHPLITRNLVALFNSPETNPCGAQLIFNTHDSNLLTPKLLRRDQIWFAEKDRVGATHLYSLAEFRQEDGTLTRKNANFEEQYIQGRFGAVPFLGDFAALFPPGDTPCAPEATTDG